MKKLIVSKVGLIALIVFFVAAIGAVAYSFDNSAKELNMEKSELAIEKGDQVNTTLKCGDEEEKCDSGEEEGDDEEKCGEGKCGEGKCGEGDDDSSDDDSGDEEE